MLMFHDSKSHKLITRDEKLVLYLLDERLKGHTLNDSLSFVECSMTQTQKITFKHDYVHS
jgi:hypothetical protein